MVEGHGGGQEPEDVVVGRVVRPHGVRGAILVKPVSGIIDSLRPGGVVLLGDDRTRATVRSIRSHRSGYLLQLEEYQDRTQAEALRGGPLRVRLSQAGPLPEHVYYYWQIIGLHVVTEEGEDLGKVEQIIETGANDVYVVRNDAGDELLLPAIEAVIREVALEQGRITVHLLPGLRPDSP